MAFFFFSVLCLDSFLLIFCISIASFWFVVIMKGTCWGSRQELCLHSPWGNQLGNQFLWHFHGDPRRTWAVNRIHDFKNRPCWRRPGPQWPAYTSPEWGRGGANALEAYSNGQLSCEAPSSATTSPGCASSHSILSSPPLLLAASVSAEKSFDGLRVFPLYVVVCFSFACCS